MCEAQRRQIGAFTLIELLVVLAILSILAGLLFPVFVAARRKAHETACISNLKQVGAAFAMYRQDWDGQRPPRLYHMLSSTLNDGRLLICPVDKYVAEDGYGWLDFDTETTPLEPYPVPVSYLYPWHYKATGLSNTWFEYAEGLPGRPGYAMCVLHGETFTTFGGDPPNYEGINLRLCFDGAVLRKIIRWSNVRSPYRSYFYRITDHEAPLDL